MTTDSASRTSRLHRRSNTLRSTDTRSPLATTTRRMAALTVAASAALSISPALTAHAGESDQIDGGAVAVSSGATAGNAVGAGMVSAARLAGLDTAVPTSTNLSPTAFRTAMVRSINAAASNSYLGPRLSGMVIDQASGRIEWTSRAAVTRMPASTQKVMTAYTVLHTAGASKRLVTRAYRSTVVPTNLFLVGAGDPSLTSARIATLAASTARSLKASGLTSVDLYLDDTIFPQPAMANGWKPSYLAGEVQRVRGLTLAGYYGVDGTVAAGKVYAAALKRNGVTATLRGRAPLTKNRALLAQSSSATIGALVGYTLSVSQNTYAEYLLRQAAVASGVRPTFTNSIAVQRSVLAKAGVSLKGYLAYDGSGLSRADRMPVTTLAQVVSKMYANPADRAVVYAWGAMPRSGYTGTLRSRYLSAAQVCARGDVLAKTGTLSDVVALAGIARGADGRNRAFALLANETTNTSATRYAIDSVATAVVGCRLG